jgi:hypothetical protein
MTLDLTDDEIKKAIELTVGIVHKHQAQWRMKYPFDSIEQIADLLEELEKELSYELMMELDVLVRVDGTPIFEGGGPVIEWLGKMPHSSLAKYGQDHEKKEYEVKKAQQRGEDYYKQNDNYRSQ